ncbi:hypothetical protein HY491_01160 [Candidatus Woesearchaeota archaeon]|nr:hypothetical protein [Candidatus Woesearchaeota archaeon]
MKRKKRGSQKQRQAYRLATIVATGAAIVSLIFFMLEQYPVEFPFFWQYLVMIMFTLLGIIFIIAIIEDLQGKRGKQEAEGWRKERMLLKARLQAMEVGAREDVQALRIADGLLAKLPDAEIERFAGSREFRLYKRVMEKHRIT